MCVSVTGLPIHRCKIYIHWNHIYSSNFQFPNRWKWNGNYYTRSADGSLLSLSWIWAPHFVVTLRRGASWEIRQMWTLWKVNWLTLNSKKKRIEHLLCVQSVQSQWKNIVHQNEINNIFRRNIRASNTELGTKAILITFFLSQTYAGMPSNIIINRKPH